VNYSVELGSPGFDGTPQRFFQGPPITGTAWTYDAQQPLNSNTKYYWRVAAFDVHQVEYNSGGWHAFTTTPFTTEAFALTAPGDGAPGISTTPVLTWAQVPGATGYRVIFEIPGVVTLDPIVVSGNTPMLNMATAGLHLNGETEYRWTVEATAPHAVLPSGMTWTFTTVRREEVTSCDLIDHFLQRQSLSDYERALGAFSMKPEDPYGAGDISSYVRFIKDPLNAACSDNDPPGPSPTK
jgi:hypothetical protein